MYIYIHICKCMYILICVYISAFLFFMVLDIHIRPVIPRIISRISNFIQPLTAVAWQVYDAVEVFAGVGMLSRCLQLASYETATLDIEHWDPFMERRFTKRLRRPSCNGNPLDLLSPAGMALLELSIFCPRADRNNRFQKHSISCPLYFTVPITQNWIQGYFWQQFCVGKMSNWWLRLA